MSCIIQSSNLPGDSTASRLIHLLAERGAASHLGRSLSEGAIRVADDLVLGSVVDQRFVLLVSEQKLVG